MSKSNHQKRATPRNKPESRRRWKNTVPTINVSRTYHLSIDAGRMAQAISSLRGSRLRHYVSGFLQGKLKMVVCINPFSCQERVTWEAIQSRFG